MAAPEEETSSKSEPGAPRHGFDEWPHARKPGTRGEKWSIYFRKSYVRHLAKGEPHFARNLRGVVIPILENPIHIFRGLRMDWDPPDETGFCYIGIPPMWYIKCPGGPGEPNEAVQSPFPDNWVYAVFVGGNQEFLGAHPIEKESINSTMPKDHRVRFSEHLRHEHLL